MRLLLLGLPLLALGSCDHDWDAFKPSSAVEVCAALCQRYETCIVPAPDCQTECELATEGCTPGDRQELLDECLDDLDDCDLGSESAGLDWDACTDATGCRWSDRPTSP